jgi:hypothetical protein
MRLFDDDDAFSLLSGMKLLFMSFCETAFEAVSESIDIETVKYGLSSQ